MGCCRQDLVESGLDCPRVLWDLKDGGRNAASGFDHACHSVERGLLGGQRKKGSSIVSTSGTERVGKTLGMDAALTLIKHNFDLDPERERGGAVDRMWRNTRQGGSQSQKSGVVN